MTRELFSNNANINAAFNLTTFEMRLKLRAPTIPEVLTIFFPAEHRIDHLSRRL